MASRVTLTVKGQKAFETEHGDFTMDFNTLSITAVTTQPFAKGNTYPLQPLPLYVLVLPPGWYARFTYSEGVLIEVNE